jgi:hypothetical protein
MYSKGKSLFSLSELDNGAQGNALFVNSSPLAGLVLFFKRV